MNISTSNPFDLKNSLVVNLLNLIYEGVTKNNILNFIKNNNKNKEDYCYDDLEKDKLKYLYSHKVSNKKLVTMFIINKDLDSSHIKSNTFEVEYPKGSGKIETFPEMDEAKWFKLDEAEEKIFNNQKIFIRKLKEYLNENTNNI